MTNNFVDKKLPANTVPFENLYKYSICLNSEMLYYVTFCSLVILILLHRAEDHPWYVMCGLFAMYYVKHFCSFIVY